MSKIISTTDLNDYMGKALNPVIAGQVVGGVNEYVENATHRCWGGTNEVTERYDWGKPSIWLRHQDVQAITSVTLGWPGQTQSTVNSTGYYINQYGRLTFIWSLFPGWDNTGSRFTNDYVAVTYTYGIATVPEDLKLAALGIAAGFYNWAANEQKDVVSASVGSYRIEYSGAVRGSGVPNKATSTADSNWAVIDSYAMRRV